ncbi:MAG: lipopolysaccharide heptosyltransferase II [Verrucomicrobiota bacterium]|jgi:heptosyltransferase-2
MENHPPSSILHPRRILVRGTNWLGDAVMTTPALMRLREKYPDAHIALLAPEKLADLWTNHPALNETIPFAPDESVFSVGNTLRAGKYDLALVFPNSPRSALEVWLAGIPQRIGYARPWRNFFLTNAVVARAEAVKMQKRSIGEIQRLAAADVSRRVDSNGRVLTNAATNAHQIHEYLHLVAVLGANPEPMPPQLVVNPDEIEAARKKFGLDVIGKPVFGLNPGAEYGPAKRWPVEKFITAARDIQNRTSCTWLTFGSKADLAVASRIASAIANPPFAIWNLAGRTGLREFMALLKLCRVLLTNDSGPMHVAAALGTPVVVPFGSTSPELTGPGLPGDPRHRLLKSDAPCSPCFLRECPIDFRCLNGISVERVVEAVLSVV